MIIKLFNKSNFAQISNKTLRDKRLSLEARGMLTEILSYSEGFETSVESLLKLLDIGRNKLLRITNELKTNGYLRIENVRGRRGQIIDKEWCFYAESQEFNFRPEIAQNEYFRTNPNKNNLFDDNEISELSDHDAGFAYVGENRTTDIAYVSENQTTGFKDHLLFKDESSQKEENKELKKLSLSPKSENGREGELENSKKPEEEGRSQFSLPEILKYVENLQQNGANIPNPQAYALKIQKTKDSDIFIHAHLNPDWSKEIEQTDYGEPIRFSNEPCSVCFGAKLANPDGKGHRKCPNCQDEKGISTGFEPVEQFRQKALDFLKKLEIDDDFKNYQKFYSEDDWQWLTQQLNKQAAAN
ncbi:MAG: hypothetical protein KGZ58_13760 [Ignavibacteriales bacterium]|nr:hypothetical protein [Ignavibacteriales bacterium]